ncbi:hypothetical protein [Brevundimonas sp.]|uniref:hypothetical protein n=1 Tax=Brevundimonas sp. TaxID=1871086 RepID=UPI003561FCA8
MRYLLIALTLCLGACALPKADSDREAQADRVYEAVRRNDVAAVKAMATPALDAQDLAGPFRELQRHVYASAPDEAVTIGWGSDVSTNNGASYRVVRRYTHPEGQVETEVLMVRDAEGAWRVDGFRAVRITAATVRAAGEQAAAARFTLVGKSAAHYLILAGAALSAILCLGSAAFAGVRKRWGWMILNLFGIGQFTLNWTTGAVGFQAIYIALFGAGFLKGTGPADPWVIMAAFPIPAILFWVLGKWRPKAPRTKGGESPAAVARAPEL